jgi:hypothetical protein
MPSIAFDENMQPYLNSAGELETVDGRKEMEQHLELKIQDSLNNVISDYRREDITKKIGLEVRRMVRETDYASEIKFINVERFGESEFDSGYSVEAKLKEAPDLSLTLDNI